MLGKFDEYNVEKELFNNYVERMEQFSRLDENGSGYLKMVM